MRAGSVRRPFAHDAVLEMAPEADLGAPGAAITVALCGHWEHEPPCPLAPHHTAAERIGDEVHLRTLFAVEPEREAEVRERIVGTLSAGRMAVPGGPEGRWRLSSSGPSEVRPEEAEHARRLVAG